MTRSVNAKFRLQFAIKFTKLFLHQKEVLFQHGNYKHVIYDKGCRMAAEEWAKKYLMPIIVAAVILAIIQVNAELFRGRL